MDIQQVIDLTRRAAQRAAKNVTRSRPVAQWPKPDDKASELVCTRSLMTWLRDEDTPARVTIAQLQSVLQVWRDEYFTTLVQAAPARLVHTDTRTIGVLPAPDGGGGRTVKVWQCDDCNTVIPLRWFSNEPSGCPLCGCRFACVFDQDEPDPAVIREAFYAVVIAKVAERPSSAETLAAVFGLDLDAVSAALLRLASDGRVVNNGGVFIVCQPSPQPA